MKNKKIFTLHKSCQVKNPLSLQKRGEGFTLIETIVYVAALSIIIVAIGSFLIWAIQSNDKARVMRETLNNARRIMEIMTYEIKEAKSVYIPTATTTQISLETSKYLPEGEITTYIDFYLASTTIYFKKESQEPIALNSDRVEVKDLAFNQISTTSTISSIQINFKIDYKNPSNKPQYSASVNVTSTVSMRSY